MRFCAMGKIGSDFTQKIYEEKRKLFGLNPKMLRNVIDGDGPKICEKLFASIVVVKVRLYSYVF